MTTYDNMFSSWRTILSFQATGRLDAQPYCWFHIFLLHLLSTDHVFTQCPALNILLKKKQPVSAADVQENSCVEPIPKDYYYYPNLSVIWDILSSLSSSAFYPLVKIISLILSSLSPSLSPFISSCSDLTPLRFSELGPVLAAIACSEQTAAKPMRHGALRCLRRSLSSNGYGDNMGSPNLGS